MTDMTPPVPGTASISRRPGSGQRPAPLQSNVAPRRGRGLGLALVAIALSVGLGVLWTMLAQRELAAAEVQIAGSHLDEANAVFQTARTATQGELQRACRLLVEDPRLKATLAVEGMDAATIADILTDLGKLRGAGFLMVLAPDGKVFAEAGAPELRGQDLADSSVVKRAGEVAEAAVGQWVIGGKVMDLSTMAVRYGDVLVAYLVVGQALDAPFLRAIATAAQVRAGIALADKVTLTADAADESLLRAAAGVPGDYKRRVVAAGGATFVASSTALGDTAQAPRLMIARPVAYQPSPFSRLHWLFWIPPALVLLTGLFALTGLRSLRRAS